MCEGSTLTDEQIEQMKSTRAAMGAMVAAMEREAARCARADAEYEEERKLVAVARERAEGRAEETLELHRRTTDMISEGSRIQERIAVALENLATLVMRASRL
jgi:phage-related minor tail protein